MAPNETGPCTDTTWRRVQSFRRRPCCTVPLNRRPPVFVRVTVSSAVFFVFSINFVITAVGYPRRRRFPKIARNRSRSTTARIVQQRDQSFSVYARVRIYVIIRDHIIVSIVNGSKSSFTRRIVPRFTKLVAVRFPRARIYYRVQRNHRRNARSEYILSPRVKLRGGIRYVTGTAVSARAAPRRNRGQRYGPRSHGPITAAGQTTPLYYAWPRTRATVFLWRSTEPLIVRSRVISRNEN